MNEQAMEKALKEHPQSNFRAWDVGWLITEVEWDKGFRAGWEECYEYLAKVLYQEISEHAELDAILQNLRKETE